MADVSTTEAAGAAAPENPFGAGAGTLMLTAPFDASQLHAELAGVVPGIVTAVRHGADSDAPCGPQNPGWLFYTPSATAAVKKTVKAHVPAASDDRMKSIGGPEVAPVLAGVREKLAAGEILSLEEASTAIALLLGVLPPTPGTQ